MGPRSIERGNDYEEAEKTYMVEIASMGPRSIERGNLGSHTVNRNRRPACFNGAALNRARKWIAWNKHIWQRSSCFNGAALNRARKSGKWDDLLARSVGFNGAALNRARKWARSSVGRVSVRRGFNGAALNRARKYRIGCIHISLTP